MARRAGGFGSAFSQAFAAMMNAVETQRHNKALEDHWARVDAQNANHGFPTDVFNAGRAGASPYAGGGGGEAASVSKNLGANQQEAYKAAIGEGLSDGAARALVANMSGEALADPSNVHKDGPHNAHGIVQWDDQRAAAIEKQFGKPPQAMSVADQTKAAIWEMKTNPAYKQSWQALNSGASPQDMVKTLVTNYERPGDPGKAINQRLQHLGSLSSDMGAAKNNDAGSSTPTKGPLAGKAAKAADVPAASAQPVEMTSGAGGQFKLPGSGELVPGPNDAPAASPSTLGAPLPAPGAQQPNDPGALPRYGTGPADTGDPSGRMIPPAGGAPSMGYPALQPGPTNVAPSPPPQATINPETDKSPVNMGPATRADDGSRPDLTARSPAIPPAPTQASAQAAPAPTPPPAQDPRFVQVTAPNSDPTARNRPQMTALNLNLWGPNPPVAQRQQAAPPPPVTPQSNPRKLSDSDIVPSSVPAPDMSNVDFTGAAKGGPIKRFAAGGAIPAGPTVGLAAAGPVSAAYPTYTPATPAPPPGLQGNTRAATQYMNSLPGMSQVDLDNPSKFYYTAYGPGSINGAGGTTILSNYGKMTPDQVSQYNQMIAGTWTPPADTPAAAPAPATAPAPVIQPTISQVNPVNPTINTLNDQGADTSTTGTVTGAFKLPDTTTPKTGSGSTQGGSATSDYSEQKDPSQNSGGTDYSVGTDDLLNQNAGYARGGGIPARPTMRYASGASVLQSPTYNGPTIMGGWAGSTPYSALAPNQQAWADQTKSILGQELNAAHADAAYWGSGGKNPTGVQDTMQYFNQLTSMPDAVWPTAPPAAPTPMAQPAPSISQVNPTPAAPDLSSDTTTTAGPVTGAFNLPNTLTPKTPNFNLPDTAGGGMDPKSQNAGGTDYSVDPSANVTQNSAKGGPITGYDDGGGVSASAFGAPPGLGGSAPIPPVYYNPATYAGAGAPVGKGITNASAGVTVAGAVPSLPMQKGGAVGFDDGGSVDDETGMPAGEEAAVGPASGNARSVAPAIPPAPTPAPAPTAPVTPQSNAAPAYASAQSPQDVHPDLPAWTPQIKDDQGNPSKGVIGAIAGGLHYLASQLGLAPGGQGAMANDPGTSVNRNSFASGQGVPGAPVPSQSDIRTLHSAMGTDGLSEGMKNLAGMEAVRNYYLVQGDPAKADQMAASMMQYSVSLAQQHGDEAAKRYYDGDLKGAVEQLNHASEAIADGNNYKATLAPDGTHVIITNSDLNGREIWKQKVAPQEILGAALGMKDGSLAWTAYEAQAAKYDPVTAQMIRDREANKAQAGKEALLDKKEQQKQDAADAAARAEQGVLQRMHGGPNGAAPVAPTPGIPPAPGITPQSNAPAPAPTPAMQAGTSAEAGAPPSPSGQGTASSAAPPTGVDTQGGTAPPAAQGLPSSPGADLPAPGATQDTTQAASSADQGPQVLPNPAQDPDWSKLQPAQQASVWKDYQDSVTARRQWETDQAKLAHEDRSASRTQDRMDQRERFTQQQQRTSSEQHDQRMAQAEQEKVRLARVSPMDERTLQSKFDTNPDPTTGAVGKEPADWLAASQYGFDANGRPVPLDQAKQAMGQEFDDATGKGGLQKVQRLGQALVNTQRMNSHMGTDQIADALTGVATGKYVYAADPKPISDAWGDRYSVVVARPDGSGQVSMLVPESDLNDIIRIRGAQAQKQQATAAITDKAANPYAGPAIPPAPMRAPSPTAGQGPPQARPGMVTGAPPPASNPVGDWWHNMLNPPPMARGRGYNASP